MSTYDGRDATLRRITEVEAQLCGVKDAVQVGRAPAAGVRGALIGLAVQLDRYAASVDED